MVEAPKPFSSIAAPPRTKMNCAGNSVSWGPRPAPHQHTQLQGVCSLTRGVAGGGVDGSAPPPACLCPAGRPPPQPPPCPRLPHTVLVAFSLLQRQRCSPIIVLLGNWAESLVCSKKMFFFHTQVLCLRLRSLPLLLSYAHLSSGSCPHLLLGPGKGAEGEPDRLGSPETVKEGTPLCAEQAGASVEGLRAGHAVPIPGSGGLQCGAPRHSEGSPPHTHTRLYQLQPPVTLQTYCALGQGTRRGVPATRGGAGWVSARQVATPALRDGPRVCPSRRPAFCPRGPPPCKGRVSPRCRGCRCLPV